MIIIRHIIVIITDGTPSTRWKGENVSTMEVEATVSAVVGLRACVVYGVRIMMMFIMLMMMMMMMVVKVTVMMTLRMVVVKATVSAVVGLRDVHC